MNETTERVARHYGAKGIADRVLKALAEKGEPVDRLTPEMLYPFDQLHARQLAGTKDHLARLKLQPSQHLLDVGSGLGGPARYAAATFGCRVTGIDVTEDFVVAARELTERCGLADRVEFLHADALSMPFDDASFDVASCHYVAMNIADKVGLLKEISRVLKPGGRLAWGVVVKGSGGDPHYPVPWSRDPSTSFLVAADELRTAFEAAGLRIVEWTDETEHLRDTRGSDPRANVATPPAVRAAVSLGEDFPERFRNFGRNLAERRVGSISVLAERP